MQWTQKQTEAINATGNTIVSASAGSGKTAVLTERIAMLVKSGVPISQILVMTFTNAAAAEMKRRIEKRLYGLCGSLNGGVEQVDADGTDGAQNTQNTQNTQREFIYKQAQAVARANISTVHAFCLHVLHRHFHEAKLDPAFRTGDAAEMAILFSDSLEHVLDSAYELDEKGQAPDGEVLVSELCDALGGEDKLTDAITAVFTAMESQPEPLTWLENAAAAYDITEAELEACPAAALITKKAVAISKTALVCYESARMFCEDFPELCEFFDEEAALLRSIALCRSLTELNGAANAYLELCARRLNIAPLRKKDPEAAEQVKALRDRAKKLTKAFASLVPRSASDEAMRLHEMSPYIKRLKTLIVQLTREFDENKRERGVISFADMEHIALSLLKMPHIADEYRKSFRYIFVDEYQDSNLVQETLVNLIRRENNLFLVGDVKQSIYSFRQAEPGLFIEKLADYDGTLGTRIDLNENFRSSPEILNTVNEIFTRLMKKESAGLDYDDSAKLVPNENAAPGSVELHIIEREAAANADDADDADDTDDTDDADDDDADEGNTLDEMLWSHAEAMKVCDRIHALMQGGDGEFFDAKIGAYRKYRYSDFAVLLRSVKTSAQEFVRTLLANGIPAFSAQSDVYFNAHEVNIVINALRIIDNRRQDIPLLAVLRSPIGGFSPEELAELRMCLFNGDMLDCLTQCAENNDSPTSEKAAQFLNKLEHWRREKNLLTVEELIALLLEETGYYDYVRALPGGDSRCTNLDALTERARSFSQNGSAGLYDFLRYLDKAKTTGALTEQSSFPDDTVTVMTIHKSKGLEFPVVFLAGIGKRFNRHETSAPNVLRDSSVGLGLKLILKRQKKDCVYFRAITLQNEMRQSAEELRILYVALTRAMSRLVLIGSLKKARGLLEFYNEPISPFELTEYSASYLRWIAHALLNSKLFEYIVHAFSSDNHASDNGAFYAYYYDHVGKAMLTGELKKRDFDAWVLAAKNADGEIFKTRFAWEYPHLRDSLVPSKLSVTGISRRNVTVSSAPEFCEKLALPEFSPAERGTLLHLVLEHIGQSVYDIKKLDALIADLLEKGLLTRAQADAVDRRALLGFVSSKLFSRMCKSNRVIREARFNYLISASRLSPDYSDAQTLLQGVIDCAFIEDGEWIIVDYKSDSLKKGVSLAQMASVHETQLSLYSEALSALTKIPVREKYIYFTAAANAVKLD